MRFVLPLALALLGGAAQAAEDEQGPSISCDGVSEYAQTQIDQLMEGKPHVSVKPSREFFVVQKLACLYGISWYLASVYCIGDYEGPDYFGKPGHEVSYGLKDLSQATLISSWQYGHVVAGRFVHWEHQHKADLTDSEACLSQMRTIDQLFGDLVKATKALRKAGY